MHRLILAAAIAGTTMTSAFAQQPTPEQMEIAYNAARNQLGVLAYCQEKGFIDGSASEIQTNMMTLIPAPADASKGDAAEAIGREGKISAMGMEQELQTAAKAQGIEEAKLCETMASALKQAAANMPN